VALAQAQRVRDSRGVPEFVFNPRLGETYQEALDIKGNPSIDLDWYETKSKVTGEISRYTVAHWCTTEARFRNHLKKIKPEQAEQMIPLDNMLVRITQQDVVYRYYLLPERAITYSNQLLWYGNKVNSRNSVREIYNELYVEFLNGFTGKTYYRRRDEYSTSNGRPTRATHLTWFNEVQVESKLGWLRLQSKAQDIGNSQAKQLFAVEERLIIMQP